jgi:hypothetical protein
MSEGWYQAVINGKDWSSPSKNTARKLVKSAGEAGKNAELRLILAPGKGTKLLEAWKDGKKIK